jgi:small subunit ribosomal protein S16
MPLWISACERVSFHAPLSRLLEPTKKKTRIRRNVSMVRIRLRRVGMKGQPSYRIVAADKESPRDGRFLEILGFYNPRTEPATLKVQEDRVYDWISKGAQLTESVEQIFNSAGVLDRYTRFQSGEELEKLLGEAQEAEAKRNVNPKTRRE